jgi:hypothetical protein
MRHHDRRSAPGCQEKWPDRGIKRRSGSLERRKHRAARLWLPGNPAVCYRPRLPEFIWGMSVDGAYIAPGPFAYLNRKRIADMALQHRVPTVSDTTEYAREGVLLSYALDVNHLLIRGAEYIDKILRGTKPVDLPLEQPTKFELVINLKTAKALGLTIPESFLLRADEVIE